MATLKRTRSFGPFSMKRARYACQSVILCSILVLLIQVSLFYCSNGTWLLGMVVYVAFGCLNAMLSWERNPVWSQNFDYVWLKKFEQKLAIDGSNVSQFLIWTVNDHATQKLFKGVLQKTSLQSAGASRLMSGVVTAPGWAASKMPWTATISLQDIFSDSSQSTGEIIELVLFCIELAD